MMALAGELKWNIFLLLTLIITAIVYALFICRLEQVKWYHRQPILFYTGLVILFLTAGSPLTQLSHVSFTAHMVNMSILYFLVPPLLLLGMPRNWLKPHTGHLISVFALIAFSALFLLYHLPFFINYLLNRPTILTIIKCVLFVSAIWMWRPITSSKNREDTKGFAVLSAILLMPACLLFIVNGMMNGGSGMSPSLKHLSVQLCIAPEQVHLIFPYQLKYDQVIGGIAMLGLHKCSIVLTCKLKSRAMRGNHVKKPSLP